ncbi:MAG: hypothetical protein HRU25_16930 [Psychrobium sp.]|nr:hypothetical protein [Psychrobium sp.]
MEQYIGRLIKGGDISEIPPSQGDSLVSGYTIIRAKDIDEATQIAMSCPIFESCNVVLEVREIVTFHQPFTLNNRHNHLQAYYQ